MCRPIRIFYNMFNFYRSLVSFFRLFKNTQWSNSNRFCLFQPEPIIYQRNKSLKNVKSNKKTLKVKSKHMHRSIKAQRWQQLCVKLHLFSSKAKEKWGLRILLPLRWQFNKRIKENQLGWYSNLFRRTTM